MGLTTLHVQRFSDWQRSTLDSWGAVWAKVVNPPEGQESPFPNQKVDVRIWTDNIDGAYILRGYDGGVAFVRRMLPAWSARPYAECCELANEADPNDAWWCQQIVRYSQGAMDEARRHGIKLCIFNFPEASPHGGDPYSEDLRIAKCKELVPAVEQAIDQGHYIGMHAYWRPGVEGPTGAFHALGHVTFTARVWGDSGVDLDRLQLLVNETGIDGGIAGHQARQGWRSFTNIGNYAGQIAEAEVYARQHPWIKALMVFTAGYEPPWANYDLGKNECYVIGLKLAQVTAPPASGLPPITPEYIAETRRHRLVLNPNAALKRAIEAAGQYPASNEFDQSETAARQYGFDGRTQRWYLWEWQAGQQPRPIYSEEAER